MAGSRLPCHWSTRVRAPATALLVDVIAGLLCPTRVGALIEIHHWMGSIGATSPHPIYHTPSPRRFTAIAGGPHCRGVPYPRFILLPCFFFPRSGIWFALPCRFVVAALLTLPRMRLSLRLPRLQR